MPDPILLTCSWCGEAFEACVEVPGVDAEHSENCPDCCRSIITHGADNGVAEVLAWSNEDECRVKPCVRRHLRAFVQESLARTRPLRESRGGRVIYRGYLVSRLLQTKRSG